MSPPRLAPVALCVLLGAPVALAYGADTRALDAVKNGDLVALRAAIAAKADVDAVAPDGGTALAWAAHRDDLPVAQLLVEAGADPNRANDYGVTPIFLACTNGSAAMVRLLLASGAKPDPVLPSGETALMEAARAGAADAVRLLARAGAKVDAAERVAGQTALMWAVANRHPDVVRVLVESGANVHATSKGGFTPFLFAAQQGDVESATLLLGAGADVNEGTPRDGTALVIAAASGREALAVLLLDKGADPDAANRDGVTALHFAASGRAMLPAVKALLAHRANPNARLTRNAGGPADLDFTGATPFFMAAASLNAAAMRELAKGGADPLIATAKHTTPLMVAAGVGRYEERTVPQFQAALDAVKVATELGTDVNLVGENQWTALHGASYTGADAIVQWLVEKGARMDVKDLWGQTPLSIAEAVITKGLADNADVRPRKFRESTSALLVKLGSPSLEAAGVEALGSMAVRRPQ